MPSYKDRYRLKADEGISYEQLTDNIDNLYRYGKIVKNIYGVEIEEPFSQISSEALNLKISEEATVTDYLNFGKEILEFPKITEFGEIYDGANPHFQLVHQIIREHGNRVTDRALVKLYTEKHKFLPNNSSGKRYFISILNKMRSQGFLLVEKERKGLSTITWFKIGRAIRTRNLRRFVARERYDPNMVAIHDYLSGLVEGASFNDIFNYMVNGLIFLETINEVEGYLNLMEYLGYIEQRNGIYRVINPIKPFP